MSGPRNRSADTCAHESRDDRGVCAACGHCVHDVVLNGQCLHCGADGVAAAKEDAAPPVVPASRLRRK